MAHSLEFSEPGEYGNCGLCGGPVEYDGDVLVVFPSGEEDFLIAIRCEGCGHTWIYHEESGWHEDDITELSKGAISDFKCNVERPSVFGPPISPP